MIRVTDLVKRYGETTAVNQLSLQAEPAQVYGLLGPNGAGKSTTIGCLAGLVQPTSGTIQLLGHDLASSRRKAHAQLGFVPQSLALYEDLNARQNLEYFGGTYGLRGQELKSRVQEVLERIGLQDRAKEAVKNFSGGMKRRLNFGAGIVHRPAVLLLDEPTVGVDPQSRVHLMDLVREARTEGTCVLYTTHYMEEAEALCDRLAIVDHGQLIAEGTLEELRDRAGEKDLLRLEGSFDPAAVRAAFDDVTGVNLQSIDEHSVRMEAANATGRLPDLLARIEGSGADLKSVSLTQPSLESLFIGMTGRELRE